jgi:peptidase E
MCLLATAMGDDKAVLHYLTEAAQSRGFVASHVSLFPMPNVHDIAAHLLEQDVVWVFGGSVAGLLAMWRLHGVDGALRDAWQAGVVLTGISAGSICWNRIRPLSMAGCSGSPRVRARASMVPRPSSKAKIAASSPRCAAVMA